jgi:hypothetical protein
MDELSSIPPLKSTNDILCRFIHGRGWFLMQKINWE